MARVLGLVLLAASTLGVASAQAAPKSVSATIDFSLPDDQQRMEQIADLAQKLDEAGDWLKLDLVIIPGGTEDKPDYRVTRTLAASGKQARLKCDNGWERLGANTSAFSFSFNPDYNHLLLTVLHRPASSAPFSTVSCEYRASNAAAAFRIQGYYAVSVIGVPEAYDFELRPVTPSLAP